MWAFRRIYQRWQMKTRELRRRRTETLRGKMTLFEESQTS